MKKYIDFQLIEEKPKTKVYGVVSKSTKMKIGVIKWYPAWRQYCFYPWPSVWSNGCLQEIKDFIEKLEKERRRPQGG